MQNDRPVTRSVARAQASRAENENNVDDNEEFVEGPQYVNFENPSPGIYSYSSKVQLPKLQGYSLNNIESWFIRLDAFFKLHNITNDSEQFSITIIHLDERLYDEAFDIITNPLSINKFITLKEVISNKFSTSSISRLEQLASRIQLGDTKPSHLLTKLQRTNVTQDKNIIRDFWLQRLPPTARAVLAGMIRSQPNISFTELSLVADEIVDSLRNSNNGIAEISEESLNSDICAVGNTGSVNKRLSNLENSISRIEKSLRTLSLPNQQSRQSNSQQNANTNILCWYHFKFGNNAKQCKEPCTFNSKN
ncbi:uncharacterized protein LOC135950643 [Calliphora vicina]|uniref:uncharacterized protein LOC135950643 n=1 Tax=Calliphora vicina TaxID=7373 RepID=UPI00325C1799